MGFLRRERGSGGGRWCGFCEGVWGAGEVRVAVALGDVEQIGPMSALMLRYDWVSCDGLNGSQCKKVISSPPKP